VLDKGRVHGEAQPGRLVVDVDLGLDLGGQHPLQQRRAKALPLGLENQRSVVLFPGEPQVALATSPTKISAPPIT